MQLNDENEKLIEELKEIIKEYEQRLSTKDKNFQLQFSELQNELIEKYSEIDSIKLNIHKIEFQCKELQDLVHEKDSVIWSKDNAIKIMQSDLKEQLDKVKEHYSETVSVREEETESLRMTNSQLREQLVLRENDIINMMQRHENQIIKMYQDTNSNDTSNHHHTINALKDEISDIREILFEKQESLKVASLRLDEQDKFIRLLQDKNLTLKEEALKFQKEIEQDQNTQKNQFDDAVKDNKKKQLTLKAKIKSLEKQCESFKKLSVTDKDSCISLNKELTVREQVIEKQNILIDELRQTETNLTRNLDRAYVLHQEQLIELQYWQTLNKLPSECSQSDEVDCLDSLTPLQLAIDTLDCFQEKQIVEIADQIKFVKEQLNILYDVISKKNNFTKNESKRLSFIEKYVNQLHESNIELHKLSKVFLMKFEKGNKNFDTACSVVENIDLAHIEEYSKEDLLLKLQILSNNVVNYSEKVDNVNFENITEFFELNKMRDEMKRDQIIQERERNDIMRTINCLNEEILEKKYKIKEYEENCNEMKIKLLLNIEHKKEFEKTIELLEQDIIRKTNENREINKICKDFKEEMESIKCRLGEKCINENEIGNKISTKETEINVNEKEVKHTLIIEENFFLEKSIEALKEENKEYVKRIEELKEEIELKVKENETKDKLCQDLSEDIASVKLKLEETCLNEGEIGNKLSMMVDEKKELEKTIEALKEENEEYVNRIGELKEEIELKVKENEAKDKLCRDLSEVLASMKLRFEEACLNEREIGNKLSIMVEEKKELEKTIDALKEENEEYVKRIGELKEEIELKLKVSVANDKLCQDLCDDIASVKFKLEDTCLSEGKIRSELSMLIEEKKELKKTIKLLEQEITCKVSQNRDIQKVSKDLKSEIETIKINLEQNNLNEVKVSDLLMLTLTEKNHLESVKEQFLTENNELVKGMILLKDQNNELLQTIDGVNETLKFQINESKEKDSLCTDLHGEISNIKGKLEQSYVKESEMESRLSVVMEENKVLTDKIESLKEEMSLFDKEKNQKDVVCLESNKEVVSVRLRLDEVGKIESGMQMNLLSKLDDKNALVELEKDTLHKIKTNNETLLLSIDNDSKQIILDLKSKINLFEIELSEKDKVIQRLEKTNLLLKAKSLKLKKQYDEKCIPSTTSSKNEYVPDLKNKVLDKKDMIDESTQATESSPFVTYFENSDSPYSFTKVYPSNSELSKGGNDLLDSDEMSFISRIQDLSDEVDSRAKKANLEIEAFLQQNEKVTSGLTSDPGSSRNNLCSNSQCQRILTKYRELSTTIVNLRQQNDLMKNKIIDFQSCLELEQETGKQISKEGVQVHNSFVQKLHDLSISKDQLRLEFISIQELLVHKTNEVVQLHEELDRYKEIGAQMNGSLIERGEEIKEILQQKYQLDVQIKEVKTSIQQLEDQLIQLREKNSELTEKNRTLIEDIKSLNYGFEYMLKNYEHCCKDDERLFINTGDWLDELRKNIKKVERILYSISHSNSELQDDNVRRIFDDLMTIIQNGLTDINDVREDNSRRLLGFLEGNNKIEMMLLNAFRRLDSIIDLCSSKNGENCKTENDNTITFEIQEETMIDSLSLFKCYSEDIVNQKVEPLNDEAVIEGILQCENCFKLTNDLKEIEVHLLTIVQDFIDQEFESKFESNSCMIINNCIKDIKNQLYDRRPITNMIDGNSQTSVEYCDINRIEELVSRILSELPNKQDVERVDELEFIDHWFNGINEMRNQMISLKAEIQFQEKEKTEISDRFEKLFVELERSCDTEIEDLKSANGLLTQDLELLHSERENLDSALRNYEIQISYLQSVINESKTTDNLKKDESVSLGNTDNQQFWLSDLNDALKETISEKEDHITELMDKINECSGRVKESLMTSERQSSIILQLEETVVGLECELKLKEKVIKDNNEVINELEAVCVEKENRINLLEKESSEINSQLEQYISAVCSMQARLEASKPNLELILTKIENKDNNMQLLNLIDQLEKDYANELEQSELNKSKIESKLNKAIQIIHKLKRQLKESHSNEVLLGEKLRLLTLECHCHKELAVVTDNPRISDERTNDLSIRRDVGVQIDDEEVKLLRDENQNYKGIIENLHVNNFLLWKELDNFKKTDRTVRGSSMPLMSSSGNSGTVESERSVSPVSQLSWNSNEGNQSGSNQMKDLQRKLQRVHQQLNQMRIERNRIHQEYSRVRQLKEVADNRICELMKKIDRSEDREDIQTEKDELIRANNQYSTQIVDLQSEIEMTKVRNSILETKCKKIELKLTSQRRKYDQLVLKLDEKEQEIDRCSDEFRRNTGNFEKEKITWLREKKEIKALLISKEEKIANLRKRLLNKSDDVDNCDSDYLVEINQLQSQLDEQKSENKQLYSRHREQIAKCQGQIEELIDDNRQLKRKLSVGHVDCGLQKAETQKTIPSRMRVIDENCEEMSVVGSSNNNDMNIMLANVVSEKEKLLSEISELKSLLDSQRQKCCTIEKEIDTLKEQQLDQLRETQEQRDMSVQTEDGIDACCGPDLCSTMVDKCCEMVIERQSSANQTVLLQYYNVQASQTGSEFDGYWFQRFHDRQRENSVSIGVQSIIHTKTSMVGTQTEYLVTSGLLQAPKKTLVQSFGCQTDADDTVDTLQQDVRKKQNLLEHSRRQISTREQEINKFKYEINDMTVTMASMESKNFEYQEVIGLLELELIERDKRHCLEMENLNLQISQLGEQVSQTVEVNDKGDQTLLCQPADEGWDMEWDYEKLTTDHSPIIVIDDGVNNVCDATSTNLEKGYLSSGVVSENVISILRDEIVQLKTMIGDKNTEIGQLKSLRNQLQNDLLESGQQIKDSNMEFLNLKETIQVLHAERDILRQKLGDLENHLEEMVNFTEMISIDLRRLRDSNDEGTAEFVHDRDIDESRVKGAVNALEQELHKLLEQLRFKDSKLENSFFQIEQLSCTIHRLQLQQHQPNDHMSTPINQAINSTASSNNLHVDCVNSINELSELLEKRHLEIEGLKSRLFLATDQLIHFRTFFANTDNQLHKELLLITRHHSLGYNESDVNKQSTGRDHTKLMMDSDDLSDSDQSLISHDGNTVIRVERTHIPLQFKPPDYFWFFNRIIGSAQYKRLVHNFKRVFTSGRGHMLSLRSQPRINFRTIMFIYLAMIHLLLMRCLFL